jgi:eukaryotic-like serine/threonine-protein kinase
MRGEPKPFAFAATEANEWGATFSPDGRWIAFASDESGRPEVYVAPFPGPGARRQLTTVGAVGAKWRSDGRELFVAADDSSLCSILLEGARFGEPMPLFRLDRVADADFRADGQQLIAAIDEPAAPGAAITVVRNWLSIIPSRAD